MTPNIAELEKVYEANVNADPNLFHMVSYRQRTRCGTACCLIGNYVGANPGCGLELAWYNDDHDCIARDGVCVTDVYEQKRIVAEHFDIDVEAVSYLFHGTDGGFIAKRSRLARLRAFIDQHKPSLAEMDFKEVAAPTAALEAAASLSR